MKYPKIKNLWARLGATYTKEQLQNLTPEEKANRGKLIEGQHTCKEFDNIKKWLVTEKIDGMNIRVHALNTEGEWTVSISGRTDAAMMPKELGRYLQHHFTEDLFQEVFPEASEILLFGEGFGPKIQNGGYYGNEQRFCLFDVVINGRWWLEYDNVVEIANKMSVPTAPILGTDWSEKKIIDYVKRKQSSLFAGCDHTMEGVVARAYPMMLTRDGVPIKFKFKCCDF